MNESVTHDAMLYIRKLFAANADGHDAEHSLRVYRNAVLIAEAYPEADMTVISLSALLHDADDHKLFQTKHNENARWFLESKVSGFTTFDSIGDAQKVFTKLTIKDGAWTLA